MSRRHGKSRPCAYSGCDEVLGAGYRSHAIYCSGSCRALASLQRKSDTSPPKRKEAQSEEQGKPGTPSSNGQRSRSGRSGPVHGIIKRGDRFAARLYLGKEPGYAWLGTFDTEEEAIAAKRAALEGLPGPVPNPGLRQDELDALLAYLGQVPPPGGLAAQCVRKLRAVNRARQAS